MLKKLAYILGAFAGVFILQYVTTVFSDKVPLLVMPMLVIVYPFLSIAYGFFGCNMVKYYSCIAIFVAFMLFCFQGISPASLVWSAYYTGMCLFGIVIKKKFLK